jgi:hypothetical protein
MGHTTSYHHIPNSVPTEEAALNYDSMSRTNNTVTLRGINTHMRMHTNGSGYDDTEWRGEIQFRVNGGSYRTIQSNRQIKASGVRATNLEVFSGSETSPNISVGKDDAGADWRFRGGDTGTNNYTSKWDLNIPNLGAPSGLTCTVEEVGVDYVKVRGKVGNWGTNATHGPGQYFQYEIPAGSTKHNSSHTTSANYVYTLNNIPANTRCFLDNNATNGGGKSTDGPNVFPVTLAKSSVSSLVIKATKATFNLSVTQGYYATTGYVQYRKAGTTAWSGSPSGAGGSPSVTVSGLTPSTDYEYRPAVDTTAGTYTGSTQSFTTKPAAKGIYPDGTVHNGIVWLIHPDGTKTMAKAHRLTPQ